MVGERKKCGVLEEKVERTEIWNIGKAEASQSYTPF